MLVLVVGTALSIVFVVAAVVALRRLRILNQAVARAVSQADSRNDGQHVPSDRANEQQGPQPTQAEAINLLIAAVIGTAVAAVATWVVVATQPWPTTTVCAFFAALGGFLDRRGSPTANNTPLPQWVTRSPRRVTASLTALTLTGALLTADLVLTEPLSDHLWLPPHKIVYTAPADAPPPSPPNGSDPTTRTRTGYVLSVNGNDTTVLWDNPRTVDTIPTTNIAASTLCQLASIQKDTRSLWDLLNNSNRSTTTRC